jgi:hypothetical protein
MINLINEAAPHNLIITKSNGQSAAVKINELNLMNQFKTNEGLSSPLMVMVNEFHEQDIQSEKEKNKSFKKYL